MSKIDTKARHQFRRELKKAVKQVSRGTDWRSIEGGLYREASGWFVSARPSVHINAEKTDVRFEVKPMAVDPILWDILLMPENRNEPLSLRYNGAFVCQPPAFSILHVSEEGGTTPTAKRIMEVAGEQLSQIQAEMSVVEFLHRCRLGNNEIGAFQACTVCALIALGLDDDALNVARTEQSLGHSGGYRVGGLSFHELAKRWISGRLSAPQ